ncbi:hypothetical protein ACUVJI_12355 [Vibrio parahaemolyticus]|uniref:hypothetical protein n=1 Tax=Vibrio parahaemolyticus TaxID=670 RepID=UPI001B82E21D|nr:hypothetical protein [Vibrio parahaemolyticus]
MIKRILKNSFSLLICNVLLRGTIFSINLIAANLLPQNQYGQLSMFRQTATLLEGFISGAFGTIEIKEISTKKNNKTISSIIALNVFLLLVLFCFIFYFSSSLVEKISFPFSPLVLSLLLFIFITSIRFTSLSLNIYLGLENFIEIFKVCVISCFLCMPLAFYISNNFGLIGCLISTVITYFICSIFYIISLFRKKYLVFDDIISFKYKLLIKQVGIVFLSILCSSWTLWYMRVLVSRTNNGLVEIANFDIVFQFLTVIMMVTGATTSVLIPRLADSSESKTKNIFINFLINYVVIILFALLIYLLGDELLSLSGESYMTKDNHDMLVLIMIGALFFTSSSIMNKISISKDCFWIVFISSVISSIYSLSYLLYNGTYDAQSLVMGYINFYMISFLTYLLLVSFVKFKK